MHTSWFTSRKHVCICVPWNVRKGKRDDTKRHDSISAVFRHSSHFASLYLWHHLFFSSLTIRCHLLLFSNTHWLKSIYTYTFRIISGFVSIMITSTSRVLQSNRVYPYVYVSFFLPPPSLFYWFCFDLQGHKSQCAWSTKKKNVKDKSCLSIYSLHKQQATKDI